MASDYVKIITDELGWDAQDYNEISIKLQDTIDKVLYSINPDQDTDIKIQTFKDLIKKIRNSIQEDYFNYNEIIDKLNNCESKMENIKTTENLEVIPENKGKKIIKHGKVGKKPEIVKKKFNKVEKNELKATEDINMLNDEVNLSLKQDEVVKVENVHKQDSFHADHRKNENFDEPVEEKIEKIKDKPVETEFIEAKDPPQVKESVNKKIEPKPKGKFSKFKKNEENKDDAPVISQHKTEILSEKPEKNPKVEENPEFTEEKISESDKPVELNEEFQEKLEKVEEKCNEIQKEIENLEVNLKPSSPPLSDQENSLKQIENRIQEAESDKNKVQVLLNQVKTSIEGIQSLETYSEANRKPNFKCKNQPVIVYEQLKQKSELTSQRLKKFREDQITRESLLAKELKKINKKIELQKKLLETEQVKIQEAKNEEYQKELEKMKQRKLKRKQELEEIKKRNQEMEALKNSKPLYKKIEEDYEKNLKKSEKNIQKEKELNRKSPINVVDLMEHAKWYEGVKRDHREKQREKAQEKVRSSSYGLTSAWTNRVLEEDQKMKKELNRASQERLNMIERKTKYAELVKEMFMPTVDRIKRQENQSKSPRGERLPFISKKSPIRGENPGFGSDGELKYKSSKLKWKDNPMVPKPLPKKQGHVVDYLEEKRKEKHEEGDIVDVEWEKDLEKEYTTAELTKVLKKKAKILESRARKHEILISGNSTSTKTLKNNENVNDMLLSSIKAKLAALEQRANN